MTEPFNKLVWRRTIDQRGLTPTAVLVLNEMFDKADMDGTSIYGSQENIAAKIGKSVESVRRAQKQLRERGLIKLIKSGSSYGKRSSSFELSWPDPDRSIETSPVKSSPVIPDLTGHSELTGQNLTGHSRGADRSFMRGSPVTGEGLPDPLPDPGLNPGLSNEQISPVIEADRSTDMTEPPTGFAAEWPLPPQLTDQPTEESITMAANTYDPWATAPSTQPPTGDKSPADTVKWSADRPLPKPGEPGYRVGRVYIDYSGNYLGTAGEPESEAPAAEERPKPPVHDPEMQAWLDELDQIHSRLTQGRDWEKLTPPYTDSGRTDDPWSAAFIPGSFRP